MSGGSGTIVKTLAAYNGELIVGGRFHYAGNVPTESLARWNGSDWAAMPALY